MENHRLFIILDHHGVDLFHRLATQLSHQQQLERDTEDQEEWVSVATYPSFFDYIEVDNLPNIFFEWVNNFFDGFDEQLPDLLQTIKDNVAARVDTPLDEDEQTHLATSIHELADHLSTGLTLLEVFVFGGKDIFAKSNFPILSALKRLDVCYPAQFVIVCEEKLSRVVWTNFIDFDVLSVEEVFLHLRSLPLWSGTVNMKIQQCNADIPLQYYFMYADEDPSKAKHPTLFSSKQEDIAMKRKVSFDSKIQLITIIKTEDVPFHLLDGSRYTLRTISSGAKDKGFDLFSSCRLKGKVFVGVLRYDDCAPQGKYTTRDWMAHVGDPFTHYLNTLYTEKNFPKHRALLLQYDEHQRAVQLYFLLPPDEIDSAGLVKLLQRENAYQNCRTEEDSAMQENTPLQEVATLQKDTPLEDHSALQEDTSKKRNYKFYTNGADIIHPWAWCEKNAWHEEENASKVVKSISRLKSDELFMQGVMIPGIEPLNNNNNHNNSSSEHDLIDTVLAMFDKKGVALRAPLQDIPIVEDRLLKSVKSEESINTLPYNEAARVIGHGLDYCTDSLNMLHLSDRLSKVQKRFIPKDTMNMMTGNHSKKEEDAISAAKKAAAKPSARSLSASSKSSKTGGAGTRSVSAGPKKESRASKTKRRLRTICEGTVVKYGNVAQKHECYVLCVDKLFTVCLARCKELTSSKDLNNLMKQYAKDHVKDAVKEVLESQTNS